MVILSDLRIADRLLALFLTSSAEVTGGSEVQVDAVAAEASFDSEHVNWARFSMVSVLLSRVALVCK